MVSAGAAQPDPTLVQTQTEAAEAAQHQYSYIALGDSIVAGIGLPDAVYQRNGRYYDVSGNYQGYSKDCYVARVAEGLGLSRDQTANYGMPALMSGDLLELESAEPYTSADLDYNNADSRVSREHDDASLRDVALKTTTVANWADYDTVYIGYPIWWLSLIHI